MQLNQEVQITTLIVDKALITVSAKYLDFENMFCKESAAVLLEHAKINIYIINLEKDKQPFYRPIYSLGLIKLEILKTHIKIYLVNGFICFLKFPTGISILFKKKPDKSFWLYINY